MNVSAGWRWTITDSLTGTTTVPLRKQMFLFKKDDGRGSNYKGNQQRVFTQIFLILTHNFFADLLKKEKNAIIQRYRQSDALKEQQQ